MKRLICIIRHTIDICTSITAVILVALLVFFALKDGPLVISIDTGGSSARAGHCAEQAVDWRPS